VDGRFLPVAIDCTRSASLWLHPVAEFRDIKNGTATDGIDLSEFVSDGTQSLFEMLVTLDWNIELFGNFQPRPRQILELREQNQTAWIGIIEEISGYYISRGKRRMELTAHTRDFLNLWKQTKLMTNAYPTLTNLTAILTDIAKKIGLYDEEIVLPATCPADSQMLF
jgi:hypothetical protein